MSTRPLLMLLVCLALVSAGILLNWHSPSTPRAAAAPVDFNRDIRPILNQHCNSCHGGVKQVNGVSFIYREEALGKGKSGRPTIVPGHPERSELIARVTSTDPEARMPYHAPPLPPKEIALLRQWIKEGAEWGEHWAFVPPTPQPLPQVKLTHWPRQPLDRFILARLEKEGLTPSPEATKAALLRRVSFDLTGLPPAPEELAAFLSDTSPDAYEKQVERLLASPHYGERWAAMWLDLARYADSKGYEKDVNRPMWPFRDWVIEAFNQNLPYDRFVITQLAGDLLPEASLTDRVATAFQRQTPGNDEGGTDDEEFRLVAVMDRVATTWSVLNGLTINCVQCHSHPYDPIRQEEYYKFLAFYNTSRDADFPDDAPTLLVSKNPEQRTEGERLQMRKARLSREILEQGRTLAQRTHWAALPIASASAHGVEKDDTLQPLKLKNGEAYASGTIPSKVVFELHTGAAASHLTALRIEAPPLDPVSARHTPEEGFIVNQIDVWTVPPSGHERQVEFRYFVPDSEDNLARAHGVFAAYPDLFQTRWIIAVPAQPLELDAGTRLKVRLTHLEDINMRPAPLRRVRLSVGAEEHWTASAADEAFNSKHAELADIERRLANIPGIHLPVMVEQSAGERRQTRLFERGNFLTKIGPALSPGVPQLFPALAADAPRNRLTMARWFFAPEQPLTARVAVNRYWEQLFGAGLVETLEDFGSAGTPPSHPELLDWLALRFQNDLQWDMKALLRELVTSATYRQRAAATPRLLQHDPVNRLLARGPRQRLTAEMVRDQALAASGLLNPVLGGAPVMPLQPEGVWKTAHNDAQWVTARGPDRYRRALYTYLKRSALYPSFVTFDAADHVVSLARRIPTNTPLQALVTLNDPVYVEAARALAQRMLEHKVSATDADAALTARLNSGAQRVLSRDLSPRELAALKALYAEAENQSAGAAPSGKPTLAALSTVASALLNLDAALTR